MLPNTINGPLLPLDIGHFSPSALNYFRVFHRSYSHTTAPYQRRGEITRGYYKCNPPVIYTYLPRSCGWAARKKPDDLQLSPWTRHHLLYIKGISFLNVSDFRACGMPVAEKSIFLLGEKNPYTCCTRRYMDKRGLHYISGRVRYSSQK